MLVFPEMSNYTTSQLSPTISCGVPVAGVSCVESGAAFLHDGAVHCNTERKAQFNIQLQDVSGSGSRNSLTDEFKRPPLFDQVSQRILHYAGRPLVDFTVVVVGTTNDALDALRRSKTTASWRKNTYTDCCV